MDNTMGQKRASFISKGPDYQSERRNTATTLLSLAIVKQKSSTETYQPSQWEIVMRKFSYDLKMGLSCCALPNVDRITCEHRPLKKFPTGSTYEGTWDAIGLCGYGIYTFPNGVIYEGQFDENTFHGDGEMRYPDGTILKGKWIYGELVEDTRTVIFSDGVRYSDNNWTYCYPKDRRYSSELTDEGMQPAGKSRITKNKEPKKIPDGTFDVGDGIFDPISGNVVDYNDQTRVIRSPDSQLCSWIKENCRTSPDHPVGPVLGLYKQWVEPTLHLEVPPTPTCLAEELLDDTYDEQSMLSYRSSAWIAPKYCAPNVPCAKKSKVDQDMPVASQYPVEVTIPMLDQGDTLPQLVPPQPSNRQYSKSSLMSRQSQMSRLRLQLEMMRNSTVDSIEE
ncbi:hypothetical protein O0L34_g5338 [Tuta absoluta]|nr:hypothetical protein O0L34_g5338 [Tuta absoluta]